MDDVIKYVGGVSALLMPMLIFYARGTRQVIESLKSDDKEIRRELYQLRTDVQTKYVSVSEMEKLEKRIMDRLDALIKIVQGKG